MLTTWSREYRTERDAAAGMRARKRDEAPPPGGSSSAGKPPSAASVLN